MPSRYAAKRPKNNMGPQVHQSPWKQVLNNMLPVEECTNCGSSNRPVNPAKYYRCRCGGVFQQKSKGSNGAA